MPNIASFLKSEISRIARKEVRAEAASLKKSSGAHRSEIASLKRRIHSLEQVLRGLRNSVPQQTPSLEQNEASGKALRFSAKGLAKHRQRLELSAEDVGLLLGVSGQSIYNWEDGKTRPRADHLPAIAALRSLSKTQAAGVLASRKGTK